MTERGGSWDAASSPRSFRVLEAFLDCNGPASGDRLVGSIRPCQGLIGSNHAASRDDRWARWGREKLGGPAPREQAGLAIS